MPLHNGRLPVIGGEGANEAVTTAGILSAHRGNVPAAQMMYARRRHIPVALLDGSGLVASGSYKARA